MKPSLQPGASMTRRIAVDRGRTISFMGEDARVYATPSMIMDIEQTCRDLIMAHADAGEDSVGIEVSVKHLAATLPGMNVEIVVKVASVEGRKVTFEVSAKDEIDAVSAGTHSRFVVDVGKTVERLKAKAAKRDALKK
ncbi:MAG: thioesterase family protein [Xanthobacteraceae bacterium]|nr:thioesterase family protein [Xanthobacteraceae bacterium]